jgi:hypothetical protein
LLERREQQGLFSGKMLQYGGLELCVRCGGTIPLAGIHGLLDGDKNVVTAAMIAGHEISDVIHFYMSHFGGGETIVAIDPARH